MTLEGALESTALDNPAFRLASVIFLGQVLWKYTALGVKTSTILGPSIKAVSLYTILNFSLCFSRFACWYFIKVAAFSEMSFLVLDLLVFLLLACIYCMLVLGLIADQKLPVATISHISAYIIVCSFFMVEHFLFASQISLTLSRHWWSLFWNYISSPLPHDLRTSEATEAIARICSKSFWLQNS